MQRSFQQPTKNSDQLLLHAHLDRCFGDKHHRGRKDLHAAAASNPHKVAFGGPLLVAREPHQCAREDLHELIPDPLNYRHVQPAAAHQHQLSHGRRGQPHPADDAFVGLLAGVHKQAHPHHIPAHTLVADAAAGLHHSFPALFRHIQAQGVQALRV